MALTIAIATFFASIPLYFDSLPIRNIPKIFITIFPISSPVRLSFLSPSNMEGLRIINVLNFNFINPLSISPFILR